MKPVWEKVSRITKANSTAIPTTKLISNWIPQLAASSPTNTACSSKPFEQDLRKNDPLFDDKKNLEQIINSFFGETGKKVVRNKAKEIAFEIEGDGGSVVS